MRTTRSFGGRPSWRPSVGRRWPTARTSHRSRVAPRSLCRRAAPTTILRRRKASLKSHSSGPGSNVPRRSPGRSHCTSTASVTARAGGTRRNGTPPSDSTRASGSSRHTPTSLRTKARTAGRRRRRNLRSSGARSNEISTEIRSCCPNGAGRTSRHAASSARRRRPRMTRRCIIRPRCRRSCGARTSRSRRSASSRRRMKSSKSTASTRWRWRRRPRRWRRRWAAATRALCASRTAGVS
mmetsp:Transcript_51149/g.135470  ORF Transcript_51149/g.135470 Transcript_51149/m.135470 type:complete len:239 (+) Transcript_51149:429-1145(+)